MFDVDVTARRQRQAASGSAAGVLRRLNRFVRSFGDGRPPRSPRGGTSRYWKRGKHKLTFKAEDEAGNKASRTITVYKVRKLPKVKTAAALALEQLAPGKVKVTGRVTPGTAHATDQAARQGLRGVPEEGGPPRGRPSTSLRHHRRAPRVRSPRRSSAGSWRVYLNYPGV